MTPLYKIAWIWWLILVAFQRTIYYENALQWNTFLSVLFVISIITLFFLIRQRRFFTSENHLFLSKDFRFGLSKIDLRYMTSVKLNKFSFEFIFAGKQYHYMVFGKSNQLLKEILEENHVEYNHTKSKKTS
ncbi:MAG: hypothetical protein FWF42_04005 [Streptococcaceae bacterium]|nr:hypothetical protein [Streptococcaceae bacterium]